MKHICQAMTGDDSHGPTLCGALISESADPEVWHEAARDHYKKKHPTAPIVVAHIFEVDENGTRTE